MIYGLIGERLGHSFSAEIHRSRTKIPAHPDYLCPHAVQEASAQLISFLAASDIIYHHPAES